MSADLVGNGGLAQPHSPGTAQQRGPDLCFRCLSPAEDSEACEAVITTLSEGLAREGVVSYFVRGNLAAAALFWRELLRARFKCSPAAPQVHCLSDFSTAAIVHRYPQERSTRWALLKKGSVLKFASALPMGKWRAVSECAQDLERQKAAFFKSHGEFLYLEAIATRPGKQRQGLGSVLLHRICHLADTQQRWLYAEASSEETRQWYLRHGFQEMMTYTLRPHAPKLLIMARPPVKLPPEESPGSATKPWDRWAALTVGAGGGGVGGSPLSRGLQPTPGDSPAYARSKRAAAARAEP